VGEPSQTRKNAKPSKRNPTPNNIQSAVSMRYDVCRLRRAVPMPLGLREISARCWNRQGNSIVKDSNSVKVSYGHNGDLTASEKILAGLLSVCRRGLRFYTKVSAGCICHLSASPLSLHNRPSSPTQTASARRDPHSASDSGLAPDALTWQCRCSLDHPIRPCQHVGWNREADLVGGFEVDQQLEFCWRTYRSVDNKLVDDRV